MNKYHLQLTKDELTTLEGLLEKLTPDDPGSVIDQEQLDTVALLSKIGQLLDTHPDDVLYSEWWIDDVQSLDDDGDYDGKITPEVARGVLQRVERDHDANVGINWDVIEYHLDEVLEGLPL